MTTNLPKGVGEGEGEGEGVGEEDGVGVDTGEGVGDAEGDGLGAGVGEGPGVGFALRFCGSLGVSNSKSMKLSFVSCVLPLKPPGLLS